MTRRELLRLIGIGVVGATLDVDKLLWIPGQKKIFIPSQCITLKEITDIYMRVVMPKVRDLFERDNKFYELVLKHAAMVELADTTDLKSVDENHIGSSPISGTII